MIQPFRASPVPSAGARLARGVAISLAGVGLCLLAACGDDDDAADVTDLSVCPAGAAAGGPPRCASIEPALITHVQAEGATTWRMLTPGDPLDIVEGNQGLFMVVLGIRTELAAAGEALVNASVEVFGQEIASRDWSHPRVLMSPGDDNGYLFDLYVVLSGWQRYAGQAATVRVELTATQGDRLGQAEAAVVLTGPAR